VSRTSSPGSRFRRTPGARPLVLGHRGVPHAAPENTLRSFELARSEGADGVEFDVRLDASGEVVVIHDRTLSRVTAQASRARVDQLSTAELRAHDVGLGERVPLLDEVLAWARDHDLCVNIELKSDRESRRNLVRAVVERLRAGPDLRERVLLSSFDPLAVSALARALPEHPVGWLVHDEQRFFKWGFGRRLLGAVALNPQHTLLTPGRIRRWKLGGGLVNTWTVNEPSSALVYAELGIDTVISDVPGRIVAAFAERR
jgi:glycerophosphoryl diester phosphodiesterase